MSTEMKRIAIILVFIAATTAAPPPLIASTSAFNATSRCVSRDVRTIFETLLLHYVAPLRFFFISFAGLCHLVLYTSITIVIAVYIHGNVTKSGTECNFHRCCAC